jgi:hypothetical protein
MMRSIISSSLMRGADASMGKVYVAPCIARGGGFLSVDVEYSANGRTLLRWERRAGRRSGPSRVVL